MLIYDYQTILVDAGVMGSLTLHKNSKKLWVHLTFSQADQGNPDLNIIITNDNIKPFEMNLTNLINSTNNATESDPLLWFKEITVGSDYQLNITTDLKSYHSKPVITFDNKTPLYSVTIYMIEAYEV